jgi:hypothetical protein
MDNVYERKKFNVLLGGISYECSSDLDDFTNNKELESEQIKNNREEFFVNLGGDRFEGISEPGKITFIDPRSGEGIEITGKFKNDPLIEETVGLVNEGDDPGLVDIENIVTHPGIFPREFEIQTRWFTLDDPLQLQVLTQESAKFELKEKIKTFGYDTENDDENGDDFVDNQGQQPTQAVSDNNPQNLTLISDVLTNGESQTVKNTELGDIHVDKGLTGKKGYGLLHIIEDRSSKDKYSEDEISALLYKVVDSVQNGKITVEQPKNINGRDAGRIGIEKDGIIGFVSKMRDDKDEKFIITGFAINEKKKEATEAIRTVIATYGNTPAFSDIRKQVGAVVSSLHQSSPQWGGKSSDLAQNDKSLNRQLKAANKAGYVQGVCECVAALGNEQNLGKKLLTEMKVTRDMAKQYARPETYKNLEQGIFAPKQEQKMEQTQGVRR